MGYFKSMDIEVTDRAIAIVEARIKDLEMQILWHQCNGKTIPVSLTEKLERAQKRYKALCHDC